MTQIKITTINTINVTAQDVSDFFKGTPAQLLVVYTNILDGSVEHSHGLDNDEIRRLENDMMALTNVKKGLVFRIVKENEDGYNERVIISDGMFHSVSL